MTSSSVTGNNTLAQCVRCWTNIELMLGIYHGEHDTLNNAGWMLDQRLWRQTNINPELVWLLLGSCILSVYHLGISLTH